MEYLFPLPQVEYIDFISDQAALLKRRIESLPLCHQLVGRDGQKDKDVVTTLKGPFLRIPVIPSLLVPLGLAQVLLDMLGYVL